MDCYTHMKAHTGKRLFLQYKRFELEEAIGVDCVDKFNAYDGSSASADKFYPNDLCGTHDTLDNINTTSSDVFFNMTTDNTAVSRGVEIILTAFYDGDYNYYLL